MPKKEVNDSSVESAKRSMGKEIVECRKEISQRKLAGAVGLPPSNMKYIEDGVNAPSPEIYEKLIVALKPDTKRRKRMDRLYMTIRKAPPPDVCKVITDNEELNDAMRLLEGQVITPAQIKAIKSLLTSFKQENRKGAIENG